MPSVLAVLNPIALKIGPIQVHWYALIMITGISLAIWLVTREARRVGLDPDFGINLATWAVPIAILGARAYEVFILQWPWYSAHLSEIPMIWHGGLAIHGGVIAGTITGVIYCLRYKQPVWKWADVVMPAVIFAQAVGRWGNFVNQEAYGEAASPAVVHLMPAWLRDQMTIQGVVYHPTFLYESVLNLLAYFALVQLRKRNLVQGTVALWYVIFYSVIRFVLESIRMDSTKIPWLWNLRVAQLAGIILVPAALALLYVRSRSGAPRYTAEVSEQS